MNRVREATPARPQPRLSVVRPTRRGNGAGRQALRGTVADLVERNRALEAELGAVRREQSRLASSLSGAAQLQRQLCGARELRRGRFEIASEIFPLGYISGDFYDVFDRGRLTALVVGDIAGKDLAAGFWFSHLLGLIRIQVAAAPDPAAALAGINRLLFQVQEVPHTASLFLGWLDAERGELLYSNAGHPPALLLRRDETIEQLREGGPLLGALPRVAYANGRARLNRGDALIGYSDGLLECRNPRDEEFGLDRLLAAARAARRASANTLLFSMLGAVQDFAGTGPREDDFALMVVRHLTF